MSAPVVMRVEGQFNFGNDRADFITPKEYILAEQGSIVGGTAELAETGFTSQTTARVTPQIPAATPTPAKSPPPAPVARAEGELPKGDEEKKDPEPAAREPALPTAPINITNTLSADRPVAAGGLFRNTFGDSVKNPGRFAVLQGMNNKITERILATMANPPWDKFTNPDYGVYFAIVQVSCNPGWRTRVSYAADLSATCEYYDQNNHRFRRESERHQQPLIFSVLPLIDAQTLELSNGERRLTALAAQINAAYPTVGLNILGQELISFVRRTQRDVLTRTPVTVSNPYSTGRTFGFRLAPSLTALRDPASRRSGAANVLQSTSFPVLVTVVANCKDFKYNRSGDNNFRQRHHPREPPLAHQ